jgi:hypothetical protein
MKVGVVGESAISEVRSSGIRNMASVSQDGSTRAEF